jgi:hypothetical protein
MGYGRHKNVSYEVQPTSNQKHANKNQGVMKMSKVEMINDITGKLWSNGMLPH